MRRSGLTFVEFLAVFSIILIIASVIFLTYPILQIRVKNSHITVCISNVKNIGGAMFQYQVDFNQIPTIHADPEQIHASQEEVARSLALLFTTDYADSPVLFECPVDEFLPGRTRTLWHLDSTNPVTGEHTPLTPADAFAAALALENPEQGTSYLLTPNFHIRDRTNKPILADRGGEATADGYTTNHGDTDTTRGEWGGTVLRMDNSQQTIRNPDGYIPHSPGNETIPLWINTNTDTTPLTDRNRAAIWK